MNNNPVSLKRNYIFKLLYQFLSLVVPLLTTPYVSRVLGADGIGKYSYASSVVTYFTMLASLGTITYGTREVAQCRDDKQMMSNAFWGIEMMTLCTSLVSTAAWLILICLSTEYRYIFFALLPMLIAAAADISWLYTGLEKVHYTVSINLACKLAGVIAVFAFIREKDDLLLYVFIMSTVTCLGNFSMWAFLPKMVLRPKLKEVRFGKHFRETLKYFITSVAISIYTVLDKTMIGLLTNDSSENGYYEQASKIINMAKPLAFSSINDIMTPRMSYLFAKKQIGEATKRINYSLNLEFMLSVGCCFGLMAVSNSFVPLFFGPGYEPVENLIKIMAPILVFICVSTCLGSHYYVPSGNILSGTKLTIVGAIINIIINVPLILRFGAYGAVVASLIAEGVIAVLYAVFCRREIKFMSIGKLLYKKVIAGVLMFLWCVWVGTIIHYRAIGVLLIQVGSGLTVYLILLGAMKDESVIFIYNILNSKFRR